MHYALAIGACGNAEPPQAQAALDLYRQMVNSSRSPTSTLAAVEEQEERKSMMMIEHSVAYLELLEACWKAGRGQEAVALLFKSGAGGR